MQSVNGARPLGRPKLYDTELRISVTDRQRDAVDSAALEREVPVAQVIRDLINEHLLRKVR